ncbi:glutathione S-transferase family protein [Sorangium sp. So ce1024]|uniref:glutathione S-transferase family protein n=1 Tax=Sorangium sp. So ce1024 TaxID=3133327 RepID=UPI003F02BAFA
MTTAPLQLYIGSKNLSSWSLRPWLAMSHAGVPFEEHVIPYELPDWVDRVAQRSPTRKVPVLRHGDLVVWESLAICEYVAEVFPAARLWPEGREARAVARAVSSEMHAGFADLRRELPMDVARRHPRRAISDGAARDVARVLEIFRDCRARFGQGGPFLFGAFSIADAMFAPVVTRLLSYDVEIDEVARAYAAEITALPAMARWSAAAAEEVARNPHLTAPAGSSYTKAAGGAAAKAAGGAAGGSAAP